MKIILGLGNPGEKYTTTRHNVGFLFLDYFAKKEDFPQWKYESKFLAEISQGSIGGEKILLVKPQTFMNLSGTTVQKILQFYKLKSKNIIVIYDDKDMDFGKIRIREKGSAGGHNGIKDIIKYIGDEWNRIKIGVGKTPKNFETTDWVLSRFSEEEEIELENEVFKEVYRSFSLLLDSHIKTETLFKPLPSQKKDITSEVKKIKKIYCIGIGGIGISALARYYNEEGYKVFGSDSTDSELIQKLQTEDMDIIIGERVDFIDADFKKVIYSEAIPETQAELQKAKSLGLKTLTYPEALGEVVNDYKLIAIAGTHGKSTTTSIVSQLLLDTDDDFISIVGTILKEFGEKNFYRKGVQKNYAVIEACEYKKHFLNYRPLVAIITNIDYDHADYFKTQSEYTNAFELFIENIRPGGFCILGEDINSTTLLGKRNDISYIQLVGEYFLHDGEKYTIPDIALKIPGEHILYDARLAYIVGHLIGISDEKILKTLSKYSGVWRRMEQVGETQSGNILMSDYGHHPTEIQATLEALKKGYPEKKLLVIFQPHQYSRTLELLDGFQHCFSRADTVIIPNIYASRDSEEDMQKISTQSFAKSIHHPQVIFGDGFENTLKILGEYESKNLNSSIILLQGAGDIDTLRQKIPLKK